MSLMAFVDFLMLLRTLLKDQKIIRESTFVYQTSKNTLIFYVFYYKKLFWLRKKFTFERFSKNANDVGIWRFLQKKKKQLSTILWLFTTIIRKKNYSSKSSFSFKMKDISLSIFLFLLLYQHWKWNLKKHT